MTVLLARSLPERSTSNALKEELGMLDELADDLMVYLMSFMTAKDMGVLSTVHRTIMTACLHTSDMIIKTVVDSKRHLFDDTKPYYGIDFSYSSSMLALSSMSSLSPILLLHEMTKSKLFIVGGGSIEEGLDSYRRTDRLDVNGNKWYECRSMSKRRGTFKTEAVEVAGLICVVSGDDHTACGTIEAFNPFSNQWFDLPSLPRRLMLVGSSAIQQTLYIAGGLDKDTGEYSDKVYSLNISSKEWALEQAALLKGRYGHGQCSIKNKLFIAGGQLPDPEGYTNTIEIFDPVLNQWSEGPAMLTRRIWLRLLNIKNELYAVGGDVDENGTTMMPSIEKLDSQTNTWVHVADFTILRRVFSVTSIASDIFIFGGRDVDYATLSDWDKYNVDSGVWESTKGFQDMGELWNNMKSDDVVINDAANIVANIANIANIDGSKRLIPRDKFYGGQALAPLSLSWEI